MEAGLPTDPEEAGVKLKEATGKPFVVSMEMACRAYLDDYPDAVAASALAKKMNAEILLVHPTRDIAAIKTYLQGKDLNAYVLGGEAAILTQVLTNLGLVK
ncbi:cell wall-binding repeat-containing protein [Rossellomorea vietnamensis]|uniref:cell wall-binding repeat-containing protein n=1 Tax=Rossellomorea vietnamensis TaxID=218284 RepID=UPI003CEF4A34